MKLNWDFSIRLAEEIDAIHPYPAKFIPEIPATLLEQFPRPSGLVVDPFSGSGTTLVQCQKRNVRSLGVDLNPIACLISRVKTSRSFENASACLDRVIDVARNCEATVPLIPRLDHWFEITVQKEIAALITAIDSGPEETKDIFRLALSSIIVRMSNQESDTRYAAVKKERPKGGAIMAFRHAAEKILRVLDSRNYGLTEARVIEANTLEFQFSSLGEPIAAVITSPPYPNAYEYWLYHKYRMYWLGYDPQMVKANEIGARAHFFKTNRHTADHFVDQMRITLRSISCALHPAGYAAFVVGRSKIHGTIVDNAQIIEDVGRELGFRVEYRAERRIAASRKSFNLSHANIKTETLLVLTR